MKLDDKKLNSIWQLIGCGCPCDNSKATKVNTVLGGGTMMVCFISWERTQVIWDQKLTYYTSRSVLIQYLLCERLSFFILMSFIWVVNPLSAPTSNMRESNSLLMWLYKEQPPKNIYIFNFYPKICAFCGFSVSHRLCMSLLCDYYRGCLFC